MFIKTIKIKNLKCFDNELTTLEFNIPDGKTLGSGLNIFVGENNSGKSTIFESIDFLRDNTKKDLKNIKNKNASSDDEMFVELLFSGSIINTIENFSQENKKEVFKKYVYKDNDENEEYFKLLRTSKDIKVIQLWNDSESKFKNEAGIDAPLKKLFETNFVWSDTNPNDQTSFGATTICGNLLKEIIKKFEKTTDYSNFSTEFHKIFNNEKSGLKKELKDIEQKTQKIFSEQFSDAKISFHFDELKIDSFFKNTKIEVNDGTPTYMEDKGSGMQRSVALALLQVYAEELVKHPDNTSAIKPFFLFIDEPELCLHPQAQMKLFKSILELSKTKQIFIATHSPYFFKNQFLKDIGFFIFERGDDQKIKILSVKNKGCDIFPWSPSWGEINYLAFNLPTIEFHNELYGYLESEHGDKLNYIPKTKKWLDDRRVTENMTNEEKNAERIDVSLQTYIRHSMHHPENTLNCKYINEELKESIQKMVDLITDI